MLLEQHSYAAPRRLKPRRKRMRLNGYYYAGYQDTYVKHDDVVITSEIDLIFELTSSFIKHFVRWPAATDQ